jgi:enamine deaminase RidA (YjgF/YER057c/UK114 family)
LDRQRSHYKLPARCFYEGYPASAAVRAGDLLFVSGQVALDASGSVVAPGDARGQAKTALAQIQQLVELAGGRMADVVDVMSFHSDAREMDQVFEAARDFFSTDYPAWTAVGAASLPVPGLLVSIRAIAHLGDEPKQCVTPQSNAWLDSFPVSAACRKGDLVFVSGQIAADASGRVIAPGDHEAQARHAFNRIREILTRLGASLDDVIDVISFHQDARGMVACADVQRETFQHVPPGEVAAWTAIGTPALYGLGMLSAWRAIADLSAGPRIAKTPESLWWRHDPISGGTRKSGGSLIGISGEVASDGDGEITTPGDTAGQARYAFERIREVLDMFGATMEDVVEITSFHKDPRGWPITMDAANDYFADEGPAWTPIGTTGLFREGYLHEIYALAVV